jgi:hypothetical protein
VKRTISLAAAASAAATGAALWLAVPAGAAARPAASGTENFQIMTTSATAKTASLIATGLFTAGGTASTSGKVSTFAFPTGTFKVAHSKGTGPQKFNPKTCLLTVSQKGTFALSGGTGAYKGISGKGTYQLSILAIAARVGGKCSMKKPPVAYQQVIKATGTVKL